MELMETKKQFLFSGAKMEKRELHSCKTKLLFASVECFCDDAQASLLQRCILLLDKRRGELMRIAWK